MKLLKIFILVSLVTVVILTLAGIPVRNGYKTYFVAEQQKLNSIINGRDSFDLLFVGSSRTYYHINPRIMDSVLGVNSFNAGIDGARLPEISMMFKTYMQRPVPPECVVVDLSTTAFFISDNPIFNPSIYFPFLDNDIVYETLKPYKRVSLLKLFPFLRITEWDDNIRQGAILGMTGKTEPLVPLYKGHLASGNDTIQLPFKKHYKTTHWGVDQTGINYLQEIIDICREKKIKLAFTFSPVYKMENETFNPEFFSTIEKMATTNGIRFLNYGYLPMNNNHLIFRDEHHLNTTGAAIYSKLLANDLKELMQFE